MQINVLLRMREVEGLKQEIEKCIQFLCKDKNIHSYLEATLVPEGFHFRCRQTEIQVDYFLQLQKLFAFVKVNEMEKTKLEEIDIRDCMDEAMEMNQYHVLCHATEGYYLPLLFKGPPGFDTEGKVKGGWIGSSIRLMNELMELVIPLNISLRPMEGKMKRGGGFTVSQEWIDGLYDSTRNKTKEDELFYKEKLAWFAMYEAARWSIELNTAMIYMLRSKRTENVGGIVRKWNLEILEALADGDELRLKMALETDGADVHAMVKTFKAGAAYEYAGHGFYDESCGGFGNVMLEKVVEGDTALHIALRQKMPKLAVVLIQHGSDLNVKNGQNETGMEMLWKDKLEKQDGEEYRMLFQLVEKEMARHHKDIVRFVRDEMIEIYNQYCPHRIQKLPEQLKQYYGRELSLLDAVKSKYLED